MSKKKFQSLVRLGIFGVVYSSFTSFYTHWPWILLSIISDLFFLFFAGGVMTYAQLYLFEHLEALMQLAGQSTGGLMQIINQTDKVTSGLSDLTASSEFQYHLTFITKSLALLVVVLFVIWCVFQSLSWYFAYRMSEDKSRQSFWIFWKNFVIESVPFFFATILWIFLSVRFLVSVKMSVMHIITENVINFIFAVFVIITWYFGTLCYAHTSKFAYQNVKLGLVFGVKRFYKVIQSVLFLAVLFQVINLFLNISYIKEEPFILMIVGTIIFMPALVFARILIFDTVKSKSEKFSKNDLLVIGALLFISIFVYLLTGWVMP